MNDNKSKRLIWQRIGRLLNFVYNNKHSNFYRKKYALAKIDIKKIKGLADFRLLPYLTREELVNSPPADRLFFPRDKTLSTYATSGTTSTPLVMYHQEYKFHPTVLNKLEKAGIKQTLVLRPAGIAGGNLKSWRSYPASQLIGDLQNLTLTAKLAKLAKVDSINATATVCIYFSEYLKKEYDVGNIRILWLGGEYVSKEKLKLLKKLYPKAYPIIPFVSIETLVRAYQCDYLSSKSPNLYHPMPDFYFEILSDKKISEDGEGELVATTLDKETPCPLIRYRTGDLVKIYSKKCNCGETQIMETLGRTAFDSLRIQGVTLHRKYLEKAAIKSGLWPAFDYQLHVFEKLIGTKIKIQLELHLLPKSPPKGSLPAITKEFSNQFLVTQNLTLTDLIQKDVFLPIKIAKAKNLESGYKQKLIIPHFS